MKIDEIGNDLDMLYEFLIKNYQTYSMAMHKAINEVCIFRGMDLPNNQFFFELNPKQNRRSANTENYVNLITSNSKYWKNYPKRDSSFICSGEIYRANDYGGSLFLLLPQNNATIGLCPTYDFWDCFKVNVSDLNMTLHENCVRAGNILTDDDFLKNIEVLNKCTRQSLMYRNVMTEENIRILNGSDVAFNESNFFAVVDSFLDPAKNNFKALPLSNVQITKKKEVWFSTPALCIDLSHSSFPNIDFLDMLENLITLFKKVAHEV